VVLLALRVPRRESGSDDSGDLSVLSRRAVNELLVGILGEYVGQIFIEVKTAAGLCCRAHRKSRPQR
jgi:hypothetical protein